MTTTNITELERIVLKDIAKSDFSTDYEDEWLSPVLSSHFELPMSQVRALLVTLQSKGIVAVDSSADMGEDCCGFAYVTPAYAYLAEELEKESY